MADDCRFYGEVYGVISSKAEIACIIDLSILQNDEFMIGYIESNPESKTDSFSEILKKKSKFFTDYHHIVPRRMPFIYGSYHKSKLSLVIDMTGPVMIPFELNGKLISSPIRYKAEIIEY